MIRTLLVENEKPNIDYLTGILSKNFPDIEIMTICSTVLNATEKINLLKPELVFLDIALDVEDGGIKILQHTRSVNYGVIFTTSYANYGVDAFKFSALHYLLRPFGVEDVQEAIQRFRERTDNNLKENRNVFLDNINQQNPALHKVGVPGLDGHVFITVSDIIFCKAKDNYTEFFLLNKKKLLITRTLKWIEELLRNHNFYRVHDSYLINLTHIENYNRGGEGGVVRLTNGDEVDVSRRRKDGFLKKLEQLKMIHSK